MRTLMYLAATFFVIFAAAVPNDGRAASLIGSTVDVNWYFPTSASLHCGAGSALVGAGVEYPSGCGGFGPTSIDVTANQVVVDTGGAGWSGGAFNGFIMDLLSGPTILGLAYNAGLSSMGVTGTSFTGTSMSFNFAGQAGAGGLAVFDVRTVAAIPLPAGILLLLSSLGFLSIAARRRRAA